MANWEDKATNLQYIQKTLNIGMDSIVFFDDNAFERNLVRSMLPEVTVPELPEDPSKYLEYVQGLNLFETASYSEADRKRTGQYLEQAQRVKLEAGFPSFDAYLESLAMKGTAAPFDALHFPRIAQLSQRSNQFNLRTVRYTEADVERLAQDPTYVTLYFELKDHVGNYGLICGVVLQEKEPRTLFVENWFMSCRVLKRTMEEFIVNSIFEAARLRGCVRVVGEYIPTPKNAMVANLYERMGFCKAAENIFEADVSQFQMLKTWIREEDPNDA